VVRSGAFGGGVCPCLSRHLTLHPILDVRVRRHASGDAWTIANAARLFTADKALANAETVTSEIAEALTSCPSNHYIIVSQPGVSAADYRSIKRASVLRKDSKTAVSIPDVIGAIDTEYWERTLQAKCDAEVLHIDASTGSIPSYHSMPKVISLTFAAPSAGNKKHDLEENEAFFASLMEPLLKTNYTVLWTSTPASTAGEPSREYNMEGDTQESLHIGLKRDLGSGLQSRATNVTLPEGGLFHRYQFFTPGRMLAVLTHILAYDDIGIFMGFLVGFILLMLLYVGISALASLQVTYAAFDKEQGALAKTKAQ
jgi:hypothetical protein